MQQEATYISYGGHTIKFTNSNPDPAGNEFNFSQVGDFLNDPDGFIAKSNGMRNEFVTYAAIGGALGLTERLTSASQMLMAAKAKTSSSSKASQSANQGVKVNGEKANASEFIATESLSGNKSARAVGDIKGKMDNNAEVPPIEVAVVDGKKYVINGHHRLEGAIRSNKQLEYKVLGKDEWQKYGYKTESDIVEAAAAVSKPKLDTKVIKKAAENVQTK